MSTIHRKWETRFAVFPPRIGWHSAAGLPGSAPTSGTVSFEENFEENVTAGRLNSTQAATHSHLWPEQAPNKILRSTELTKTHRSL